MRERDLLDQLNLFRRYTYSLHDPRYPMPIPGAGVPQGPPLQTNCCTFVEGLLVGPSGADWDSRRHRQMMIIDHDDLFSPVTALVETGVARALDPDDNPAPWSVMQGWRRLGVTGHTLIIVRHDPETDKALVLEANNRTFNGVGWRGLGHIGSVGCEIPGDWRERIITTWAGLRLMYPHRALCALNLEDGE